MDNLFRHTLILWVFLSSQFLSGQAHPMRSLQSLDSLYNSENYASIVTLTPSAFESATDSNLAQIYFIFAKSYENVNEEDEALTYYKKALKLYENSDAQEKIARINLEIYFFHHHYHTNLWRSRDHRSFVAHLAIVFPLQGFHNRDKH